MADYISQLTLPNNSTYNLKDANAVKKTGDTMTGSLTFNGGQIAYQGTKTTYNMIKFIDNTNDTYGNGISIGGGGLTIMGSGKSADAIASGKSGGDENLYLGSDGTAYIYTNVQNGLSSAKTFTFGANGTLTATIFSGSGASLTSLNASNISDGTLNLARLGNQNKNLVLAGPATGNAAVPTFRALVAADIPDLSWNKITSNKPTTLSGYGITDAKIASGVITLGSNTITPITSIADLTGSTITAADLRTNLGLTAALRFIGKATTDMSESTTTAPTVTGVTNYAPAIGDVVLDKNSDAEYVCIAKATANNTTTYTWELLGRSGSWATSTHVHGNITNGGLLGAASVAVVTDGSKKITTADLSVTDTNASTNATTTFVQAVTQSAQGKITVTKASLNTSGTWSGNAATATQLQTARSLWGNNFDGTEAINGNITISHATNNNMTADSTNPQITFSENGEQPVHLIYTDYDSYRNPAGLKVVGGASATPAWFEVEGNVWSAGFKITGKTTSLTDNNLTFSSGGGWYMSDTTWIRTVGSKSVYMNAGTFRNDGTTQLRTLQHVNANIALDGSWTTGATGTANSGEGNATQGTLGTSILSIGNSTARPAAGTAGGANNAKGYLYIYGAGSGYGELTYNDSMFSSNKSIYLSNTANSGINNEIRGLMAANDYWRVAGGATASNAGYMEIATADDGNEPIYVRQYSGVFSTLKRTATLLDASGNTEFPVQVTAPKFIGTLTGNATTATTWETARTLTIGATGKSVNGSANVSWSMDEIMGASDASKFYRGDKTWSDTLGGAFTANDTITANGGYLKSTLNSNTVTIGSQNASFTHIYSSANIPFIFNNTVLTTSGNLGNTTYPFNNLYIGAKGSRSIYYVGTKATNAMITFLDNTADTYGNGIKIGGGGVVVVGAGESAANLSVTASSETLYLTSDGVINIEAGGDTIANRIGIQVTTAGDVIPVKAEAANNNAQNLGTSSNKWANVYATTFNGTLSGNATTATALTSNAGDPYTPVYFTGGKPSVAYPVEYFTWTIGSGKTGVTLTGANIFAANTYSVTLVVTSGEANLNGPITWTSAANTFTIQSSAATSGAVSGYALVARGTDITSSLTSAQIG